MLVYRNPLRGQGLGDVATPIDASRIVDTSLPRAVFSSWPGFAATRLVSCAGLAASGGVAQVFVKDEGGRFGLGSFKALGGAYAVARVVMEEAGLRGTDGASQLAGDAARAAAARLTFLTASAGNHGIAVAAGAQRLGARARIYLNRTVPAAFASRLEALGAEVDATSATYDESLAAARAAGERGDGLLLADTTWPGYTSLPLHIMQGYTLLLEEASAELPMPPTHLFLQAGVGGMAAALAAKARSLWGNAVELVVVEPDRAPCLWRSVEAGGPLVVTGAVSNMGRLDCKEPSLVALGLLARETDAFVTISDEAAEDAVATLARHGLETTPSGAAGIAALLGYARAGGRMPAESRVLCILSEAAIA